MLIKRKPKTFSEAWEVFHSKARDHREKLYQETLKDRRINRLQRTSPTINLGKYGVKIK